jgi:transposase-like protein
MPSNPRPRNRHLTPLEGARLLSAWHRRGNVLQSAFCRAHGISRPTLRRWLRTADPASPTSPIIFTEVPAPVRRDRVIEVCIGSSRVSIPTELDVPSLQAVFHALIRAHRDGEPC